MGLFGKSKDYEYVQEKEKPVYVEINIAHSLGVEICFDIEQKDEYLYAQNLMKLSNGELKSCNITDSDGDVYILSSKYIRDSIVTINKLL